ncbi:MAG: DUF1653 domain-containing protein [Lentisphaerae bacterium]|nr:DUF1653 domain-containing protein [Lentisphaerota bacterium]
MSDGRAGLVGRTFRHFKGNLCRLEGFAKDSETLEEMVVYRALHGERGLWVRRVKRNGHREPHGQVGIAELHRGIGAVK